MGLGFGGQRLTMIPDIDTIIVSTNQTRTSLRGLDGQDLDPLVGGWIAR
jgi:hypothetical protein